MLVGSAACIWDPVVTVWEQKESLFLSISGVAVDAKVLNNFGELLKEEVSALSSECTEFVFICWVENLGWG